MRVLFAGTPEIAVPSLRALVASEHTVCGVLTAPDQPSGRGRTLRPSPVKQAALELEVPVLTPERLRGEAREAASALSPDLLACFAYGKIFGPRFLSLFGAGALNVHPSLLPAYRGPAPLAAAIANRDAETGITVQRMAEEMDAGDIVLQERLPLVGDETTGSLSAKVAERSGPLLLQAVNQIASGAATFTAQDHASATYTRLVSKEDGWIDWRRDAAAIEASVRALDPWPRARTLFRDRPLTVLKAALPEDESTNPTAASQTGGHPGRVTAVDRSLGILVETGNACIALQMVQLPTKKPVDWKSFLNGVGTIEGELLGGS